MALHNFQFEVCCDEVATVVSAVQDGATRIELCGDLSVGGITPSEKLFLDIKVAMDGNTCPCVPVFVMIRPRGGDFNFTQDEFELALAQARRYIELGADGLVFGSLTEDGQINFNQLSQFLDCLPPTTPVTFHRALDEAKDCKAAFEALVNFIYDRGHVRKGATIHRVLTSGGAANAVAGSNVIAQFVHLAQEVADKYSRRNDKDDEKGFHQPPIVVIPGSGVRPDNIASVLRQTQATEIHGSFRGCVAEAITNARTEWAI